MICPNCSIALVQKSIEGIQIDECEQCEGIWLEEVELRQLKDKIDADLNWMDFEILRHPELFKPKAKRTHCPSCQDSMDVLDYDKTKVEIDYCSSCKGIWLEKNELERIIEALEKELLTKSVSEYVDDTIEEAKELLTGPESFLSEWKDFSTILRFMQYRILSLQPKIHDTIVTFQNNALNR